MKFGERIWNKKEDLQKKNNNLFLFAYLYRLLETERLLHILLLFWLFKTYYFFTQVNKQKVCYWKCLRLLPLHSGFVQSGLNCSTLCNHVGQGGGFLVRGSPYFTDAKMHMFSYLHLWNPDASFGWWHALNELTVFFLSSLVLHKTMLCLTIKLS